MLYDTHYGGRGTHTHMMETPNHTHIDGYGKASLLLFQAKTRLYSALIEPFDGGGGGGGHEAITFPFKHGTACFTCCTTFRTGIQLQLRTWLSQTL